MHVYVIAEAGSTWRFGDDHLANAGQIIQAAKACGADACKFQWTSDPAVMARRRNAPELEAQYARYLHYPQDWLAKLKAMCDETGIEFMCTAYLPQDIAVIAPLVKRFKVSAFESPDRSFIEAHLTYGRQVIASSGGGGRAPLAKTIAEQAILKTLLCVSAYPAPLDQMNLARLRGDSDSILGLVHDHDGLSDHSISTVTGALAVAAGAQIIEKHMRLDDTPPTNPDYLHSLTPAQFSNYVRNVRLAEIAMGDGVRRVMPCEESNLRYRVSP